MNKNLHVLSICLVFATLCAGVCGLFFLKHEGFSKTPGTTTGVREKTNHVGNLQEGTRKIGVSRSRERVGDGREKELINSIIECIERKNRGELVKLLERVDKSEFQEVWKLLGGIGNELAADELRNRLLVRVGSSADIQEILEILEELTGPGTVRNSFIETTFGVSRMSIPQLVDAVSKLNDAQERSSAYRGIARKISYLDNLDDLGVAEFSGRLPPELLDAIVSGLGKYHSSGLLRDDVAIYRDRAADAIAFSVRAVSSGMADDGLVIRVVTEMTKNMPFAVWDALNTSFPDLKNDGKILSAVLMQMSSEKPFETMMIAAANDCIDSNLLRRALVRDNRRVEEWYIENLPTLSASQRDVFAGAFSAERAKAQDFEDAYVWVSKVENPDDRKKAESVIWTAERDSLRKEVSNDPVGTVQFIVSGQSKYTDYWIEEAMMTWISKEPDKAEEWYRANWNSLPPAKSQYVAAAYAKNALGLGDTATARQWTSLIQDPKTRERIEASITKSEGGGGE